MATVFRRGKFYWIRYTLDGKQRRESLCTRSEKVAKMKLRQYEVALDSGTFQSPSKTFLETFLTEHTNYLKGIRPKKSWVNEKNRIECFFKLTGVAKLEQLTAATIAGHLERLAARSPAKAWRPATYNRYREALVALFDYAIERFAFVSKDPKHPNPARGLRRRKVPKPEIVYLNDDEIVALLDALKAHAQVQAMVATLIFAGLRREACLWLRKRDVDLDARTIRVCSKEDDGELWTPKTNADRNVPVSSDLMRFLGSYEPREDSLWFFPSPEGRRWDADNFSHELSRIQRKYDLGRTVGEELRPYGCNIFRHTFATRLVARGKSLSQVARLMGNSVPICERHYAAFVTGEMQDVVEMGLHGGEDPKPAATVAKVSLEGKILRASGLWPAGKRTGEQAR